MRVYYDRLVDENDQTLMFKELKNTITNEFNTDFDKLFSKFSDGAPVTQDHLRSLMYCDFVANNESGLYMQVPDVDEIRLTGKESKNQNYQVVHLYHKQLKCTFSAEEQLSEFNLVDKKPMKLVLFRFAIEHICRISRLLKQPRGHALLVGVGGSGRQSLTRLSAFMADCEVFSVEIGKGYGMNEWREDLKVNSLGN